MAGFVRVSGYSKTDLDNAYADGYKTGYNECIVDPQGLITVTFKGRTIQPSGYLSVTYTPYHGGCDYSYSVSNSSKYRIHHLGSVSGSYSGDGDGYIRSTSISNGGMYYRMTAGYGDDGKDAYPNGTVYLIQLTD